MMKALVIDRIHEDGIELLKQYCDVDIIHPISPEELAETVGNYDLLLGRATPATGRIERPILETAAV